MADDNESLTRKEKSFLKDLLIVISLLFMFIIGFWMLEQTMNSVVILKRDFVDLAFNLRMDVWRYHDISYALLWLSYIGFVIREITPWKKGELTSGRVIISLLGFASLTAGLFLSQDVMNAVLILDRSYIDYPFFVWKPDLFNARDSARMLIIFGYVGFFALIRMARR